RSSPLLSGQVALGLAGALTLLLGPAALLVLEPGMVADSVVQAGAAWNWLAVLLATAAAPWHAGRTLTDARDDGLGGLGLAVSGRGAGRAGWWAGRGWRAYHALTAGCAVPAAVCLAGGWLAGREPAARGWVTALGLLVVSLALRGVGLDPADPWWP